jgi:hypothetical protein
VAAYAGPMNTIPGLRVSDLSPLGSAWPSAPVAPAGGPGGPSRWLDGLAATEGAALTADVPADASGLGAAGHAQRVLAALLADDLG